MDEFCTTRNHKVLKFHNMLLDYCMSELDKLMNLHYVLVFDLNKTLKLIYLFFCHPCFLDGRKISIKNAVISNCQDLVQVYIPFLPCLWLVIPVSIID